MRLWSLHPKYLDAKGLVALWREGLLALHVLKGLTKGYKNHPQLLRFKKTSDPVAAIKSYLAAVVEEARQRGYNFDAEKIAGHVPVKKISVTKGQVAYERDHLRAKLEKRDPGRFKIYCAESDVAVHPMFKVVEGEREAWEVVSGEKTASRNPHTHYVYVLLSGDGKYYTGYTTDLEKRLKAHKEGKGAKFTRAFGAQKIVYSEKHASKSAALKREWEIKKLSRGEKMKLMEEALLIKRRHPGRNAARSDAMQTRDPS